MTGAGLKIIGSTHAGFLGKLALDGGITRLDTLTALPTAATISINSGGIFRLNVGDDTNSNAGGLGTPITWSNALTITFNGGTLQTTGGNGQARDLTGVVTAVAGTTTKIIPTGFGSNETQRNLLRLNGRVTGDGTIRIEAPNHGYPGSSGTIANVPVTGSNGYGLEVVGSTIADGAGSIAAVNPVRLNAITGPGSLAPGGSTTINLAGDINATGGVTLDEGAATIEATGTLTLTDAISGAFLLTKVGNGTLNLNGAQTYSALRNEAGITNLNATLANATITDNGGVLNVNANANNSAVIVNNTGVTHFTVSQTLASLTINAGGYADLGPIAGAAPSPAPAFDDGLASAPLQGVPEPGTAALLLSALGTLLAKRRRRA